MTTEVNIIQKLTFSLSLGRHFEQEKYFFFYKSWILTPMMKMFCLFKHACAQYFQKEKLLENKSFCDKNGGKTRLTLWCHISNYKITLNLHVYMNIENKELQKNISDGKGANLGQYHI